jgi:hypothetical protein
VRMFVKGMVRSRVVLLAALVVLGVVGVASSAQADPVWRLTALSNTTVLPGDGITFHVEAFNVGTSDTDGSTTTTTVALPTGMTAVSASGTVGGFSQLPLEPCTAGDGSSPVAGQSTIQCNTATISPDFAHHANSQFLDYTIVATVDGGVGKSTTLTTSFDVSGGGALTDAATVDVIHVDDPPNFGLAALDGSVSSDSSGAPLTQAGAHPYSLTTSLDFNTVTNPLPLIGDLWPVEPVKDVVADLPPGLVGGTAGVDQCTSAELSNSNGTIPLPLCPATSQVGTTLVRLHGDPLFAEILGPIAVYNMVPPASSPARFGFNIAGTPVTLTARVRTGGDYGVSADVNDIPAALDIAGTSLTFWGVPSDSSHDFERACPGQLGPWNAGPTCSSGARPRALFRNPTSCVAPAGSPVRDGLVTSVHVDSWDHPGGRQVGGAPSPGDAAWKSASFVSHDAPGYPNPPGAFGPHLLPTGCDKVPFDPSLSLQPSGSEVRAGSPTGFSVDVDLPQTTDPNAIGEADLKKAVVTLPEGMRVSASSADGLGACSPAQIGLDNALVPSCPDSSKVGTLQITTPLLDTKLDGSVYLATPNANPFHSLIAIYLVARGAGVVVKIPGEVVLDQASGRISTVFDNNPQVPFSKLHLEFFGGARAALAAPSQCGSYTTTAQLYSWAQPDKAVESDSTFSVDRAADGSACAPQGFSPGFSAGSATVDAGKATSFGLRLTRSDSDQELSSLGVDLPTGALAKIANVTLCPDAAAATGTCQDVSKVGDVTVGAGAGPNPFYITTGRAYFTGPYKGAPFGLSIVVPAVAGPFDLGDVIVRARLDVDRTTAQARVTTDPFPTILDGIPLGVRDVRTSIDRPDFFVNPTNCSAKRVLATVGSTQGAIVHVGSKFQVANCATLPLAPRLAMTIGAPKHTKAGVSTPVTATLTMPKGDANLRSTSVTLPGILNARLPVVNRACTLVAFQAGHCGDQSKAGTAVAVTPLLRDPLRGGVYFVKNPARVLPDLMVALRGQVALDVTAKVSIPGGKRLGTRFDTIPDAPITKFTLRIVSGKNGPVGIVTNLCSTKARTATAAVSYRGQNGATVTAHIHPTINGCPHATKARNAEGRR